MDLTTWTTTRTDPTRRRRLVFGYTVGSFGAALVALVVAVTAGKVVMADEDVPVDVTLATAPEEQKEPEPEPAPEPEPEPAKAPGPRLPKLAPPTEIPKDKPAESASTADDAYGDGDPYAKGGGGGASPPPKATQTVAPPPPPPPPPKPKPSGPVRLTENDVPPVSVSMGAPQYPAAAKAAGIEGTVVVKYVVTESGAVTNVQVVRGPSELHAACIAAVQSWRFKPALRDGTPIAVSRVARFPFRIKT